MAELSKYEQALAKYNCDLDDAQVKEAVKKIIAEKVHENDTLEVKKFLFGSIELTTLKTTDSEESVMAFTEKVNQFDEQYGDLPHVATICVYPCFAKTVAETLEIDGVEIACVSGSFPSSQALIEVKVAETALAVKDGATEIDIVMPVGKFLSGDYEGVCDDIQELKDIQTMLGTTMVYITHDQEEAFAMSDHIIVMSDAKIHQHDTPANIVDHPADDYVRDFVIHNLKLKIDSLSKYAR